MLACISLRINSPKQGGRQRPRQARFRGRGVDTCCRFEGNRRQGLIADAIRNGVEEPCPPATSLNSHACVPSSLPGGYADMGLVCSALQLRHCVRYVLV